MKRFSRRSWLQVAGLGSLAGGAAALGSRRLAGPAFALRASAGLAEASGGGGQETGLSTEVMGHSGHVMGPVGRVSTDGFHPTRYLRSWNFSDRPPGDRAKFYRETPRPDGTTYREYQLFAVDREIEIAPGVFFPAWTYNGQVPGPTIRATEGDTIRVTFTNQGVHPHTIHFHGWHQPAMDGSLPEHQVLPGDKFVYEFTAEPYGLHLYHCHSVPLKRHIHKGLYGAFIIDPKTSRDSVRAPQAIQGVTPADELVMMMNGFDTNFDADNEVYAVNTVANFHMHDPIRVEVGRLVRIYLINVTEFDVVNSLHLHGMFFDVHRTGTRLESAEHTDTVMLCQGERAILETVFRYPGDFMFHAHQSEFAELGWMGLFRAEARRDT